MLTSTDPAVYDITIIGAGPVGLYGLYYASQRDMKAKIVDALPEVGGQLTALYPEKYIYDVPGFPKILAREFVRALEEQAFQHNPTVCLNEPIVSMERLDDGLIKLLGEHGSLHLSKTVLIAAGIGAFTPKRLDVPGIEALDGRGIYYFASDLTVFKGRKVLIVGGGDTAVDWALHLVKIAEQVTLVHRSDRFRALERNVAELYRSPVDVRPFHELKFVLGEDWVEGATIFDNRTGHEETFPVDAILMNIGFATNLGPVKHWGLEIDRNAVVVNPQLLTSLPGVFAAGDIAVRSGHLRLISVGSAEAAIAVNNAKHFIDPAANVEPTHSSELVPRRTAAAVALSQLTDV